MGSFPRSTFISRQQTRGDDTGPTAPDRTTIDQTEPCTDHRLRFSPPSPPVPTARRDPQHPTEKAAIVGFGNRPGLGPLHRRRLPPTRRVLCHPSPDIGWGVCGTSRTRRCWLVWSGRRAWVILLFAIADAGCDAGGEKAFWTCVPVSRLEIDSALQYRDARVRARGTTLHSIPSPGTRVFVCHALLAVVTILISGRLRQIGSSPVRMYQL